MSIPISLGSGAASIAATLIGDLQYQNVIVISSVAVVAPAGSIATVVNPAGSVTTVTGAVTAPAGSIMTVTGSVTAPAGSVMAVTVFGTGANTSVLGSVTALQGTNPWTTVNPAGSVTAVSFAAAANQSVSGAITNPPGSVTAVRTDNASVITVWQNSSIIAINAGSVVTISSGSVIAVLQAASIVGTYAEDAAHTTAEKGLFVLGVRNDLMASVTGADGDYSQIAVGPVGENIVANAPISKWVRGTADLRVSSGGSIVAIAAQGASVFTYITSAQFANMGPSSVLVTITGGLGSILAYTIAPAGGGSNITYPNALKTGENSAIAASISGISSVLVSLQGFTAKI